LLLHSEVVKLDYPWLYDLLKEHKQITEDILLGIPAKQKLIFDSMIRKIILTASQEWKGEEMPVEDLADSRIKCALCQTDNRYVFVIVNRLNGTTLNVGSSCIYDFGITFGRDRKTIKEMVKERKRSKQKENVIINVPGFYFIENWNEYKTPIALPTFLTDNFYKRGSLINKYYEEYLNEKRDDEVFPELIKLLAERDFYIQKFDTYVAENKDKPFVITTEMVEWSANHLHKDKSNKIYNTGYCDFGLACYISEPTFMKSLIPGLNGTLKKLSAEIVDADWRNKAFIVKPTTDNEMLLRCSQYSVFCEYGAPFFNEELDEPLSLINMVEQATIHDDSSLTIVLNEIDAILKKKGYYVKDVDLSADEVTIFEKDINRYVRIKLTPFANQFIAAALSLPTQKFEDIAKYIKSVTAKRFSDEELRDRDSVARLMRENPFARSLSEMDEY